MLIRGKDEYDGIGVIVDLEQNEKFDDFIKSIINWYYDTLKKSQVYETIDWEPITEKVSFPKKKEENINRIFIYDESMFT